MRSIGSLLPAIEEQIRRVSELDFPRGEASRIDALLDNQQVVLDSVAVMPDMPTLSIAERRFAKTGQEMRSYGLAACAFGGEG
jgi:hypothetical protein